MERSQMKLQQGQVKLFRRHSHSQSQSQSQRTDKPPGGRPEISWTGTRPDGYFGSAALAPINTYNTARPSNRPASGFGCIIMGGPINRHNVFDTADVTTRVTASHGLAGK